MSEKMMKQYVVDAFTDHIFSGNPAAICVMEQWPDEELMQGITNENNLSETAFTVREGKNWHLRWFTPGGEIDLCGHATLATAYVLMNYIDPAMTEAHFNTLSGELIVYRKGDLYEMDFPAYELKPVKHVFLRPYCSIISFGVKANHSTVPNQKLPIIQKPGFLVFEPHCEHNFTGSF